MALELFDQLVLPVMLYGCEVWGYEDISALEILHRKFIKMLCGIYKCTPNVMVYGESGCFTVLNHVLSRMTTFYMRLLNGNKNKLSYIMYQVMRRKFFNEPEFICPWMQMIENTFNRIGMGEIWTFEGMGQKTNYIKHVVKIRIRDIYIQEWADETGNHDYCTAYKGMKKEWGFEKYLIDLNYHQRISLSKFRCRSNYLPITKSRFTPCTDEELECPLCDTKEIGDELHYLTKCEYQANSREEYLGKRMIENIDRQSLDTFFNVDVDTLIKTSNFVHIIMNVFKRLT